jgi:hypothetical protein
MMLQYVLDLYKDHLVEKGEAGELVKLGHVPEALELYVQQSDWPKVLLLQSAVRGC